MFFRQGHVQLFAHGIDHVFRHVLGQIHFAPLFNFPRHQLLGAEVIEEVDFHHAAALGQVDVRIHGEDLKKFFHKGHVHIQHPSRLFH